MTDANHIKRVLLQSLADGFEAELATAVGALGRAMDLAGAGVGAATDALSAELGKGDQAQHVPLLEYLGEQLSALHSTIHVVNMAAGAALSDATTRLESFEEENERALEEVLADVFEHHPQALDEEADRIALELSDDDPLTAIRRSWLGQILRQGDSEEGNR